MITLGVKDIKKARGFYKSLGFQLRPEDEDSESDMVMSPLKEPGLDCSRGMSLLRMLK